MDEVIDKNMLHDDSGHGNNGQITAGKWLQVMTINLNIQYTKFFL